MSSIPNSAMPHAQASEDGEASGGAQPQKKGAAAKVLDRVVDGAGAAAERVVEAARDNPKTAIAAGVAVAGAVVAAGVAAARGRGKSGGGAAKSGGGGARSSAGGAKSGGAAKSGGTSRAKPKS
jgi:hypothetical protein